MIVRLSCVVSNNIMIFSGDNAHSVVDLTLIFRSPELSDGIKLAGVKG
jgi:hypothetical protein